MAKYDTGSDDQGVQCIVCPEGTSFGAAASICLGSSEAVHAHVQFKISIFSSIWLVCALAALINLAPA
jgi:hypothetical protein